jgi:hypothetical protein
MKFLHGSLDSRSYNAFLLYQLCVNLLAAAADVYPFSFYLFILLTFPQNESEKRARAREEEPQSWLARKTKFIASELHRQCRVKFSNFKRKIKIRFFRILHAPAVGSGAHASF